MNPAMLSFSLLRRRAVRVSLRRSYATVKPAPYGQPRADSHPHLLKSGEMTSGIMADEYEARRTRLMNSLPDNAAVLCVAAPVKFMSEQIFYKYRQNSDFWYLTGWQEPEAAVLLQNAPSTSRGYRMTAFVRPKDEHAEKWEGARTGLDVAAEWLGADEVMQYHELPTQLSRIIEHESSSPRQAKPATVLYTDTDHAALHWVPRSQDPDTLVGFLHQKKHSQCRSLKRVVAPLRVVKSPAEQAIMRRAATLTALAHRQTMTLPKGGLAESDLAAHFTYVTARGGSQRLAYEPVVASGANGMVIHYTSNTAELAPGELVLMDAGCELDGYASDITRTFPVSGSFSSAQRDLYSAVLAVQKTLISRISERAGRSMWDLHYEACKMLGGELERIGFPAMKEREVENWLFPHSLGHSVGIDLHEPHFDSSAKLRNGMVVTIEPGVYVPPMPRYPAHFHNLAIRIEDEVLVQDNHSVVLTSSAPKEVVDVEGACQDVLGLGYL